MFKHVLINRLQTLLLVLILLGIVALSGWLLLGVQGLWVALGTSAMVLMLAPSTASWLTLRLYHARLIPPEAAPRLWQTLGLLAERANLPSMPIPHYVPSPVVSAFAVGNQARCAIALTDGLLRSLSDQELAGVLAHEVAHIFHGDLRVMGLADYVSRLTSLFALIGQIVLLAALPCIQILEINWLALLLLIVSPHLSLIAQLGLSRVREFDADLKAAELTGDPEGLASALARIERTSRSWRRLLFPGWGNPEPSWLRTHPATEERIRRLLALRETPPMGWRSSGDPVPSRLPPDWRSGSYWR